MPLPALSRPVLVRSILSYRIQLYSLVSLVAVSAVVLNALRNYSNFYSVAIYLSKSGRSVLVLANFAVLLALFCGHVVQRIFFGALRANEVERLYDRLWFFITESLLAFTIFRDEFDIPFVLMFGFLLFVKSFHWLASDRIEWMDQQPYPGPPVLFHFRMSSLFIILWLTDFIMFVVAIDHTITYGVGGMVLFASEYGILMASIMNTILKYLLSAYDLRRAGRRGRENAPPWENKSMWIFYIELTTDFLKLTTYLVFFTIIITFYGLPLNIVRDVYITARSFITRLRALHRYQTATRNMDQRYPNATEAELTAMSDRTCIICREDMVLTPQEPASSNDGPNVTPKKLPCGHVFHFYCLRSWLERQQSCPTCRQTVLENNPPPAAVNPAAPGAPQQGNNIPQPQNNNNLPGNPLGNPLAALGRLFGPPGQQVPNVNVNPNQFAAQGRIVQNPNPAQNNPVVIQYHIQYQVPRQPGPVQNAAQNPPPVLQPIQPFQGFQDPNGVWQQWPVDQDIEHPSVTQATQEGSETVPSTSAEGSIDRGDARSAAAQAALRRLNTSNSMENRNIATDVDSTTSAGSISPTSTTSVVPRLIPLHDYTTMRSPRAFPPTPMNGFSPVHQTPVNPSHSFSQLGQIPQHVTNAQLEVMDQLTREAIDERLRVLENVSGTLYHCVEDLLRLRSTLPVNNAPNSNSPGIGDNRETTVDNERKGKSVVIQANSDTSPLIGSSSQVDSTQMDRSDV